MRPVGALTVVAVFLPAVLLLTTTGLRADEPARKPQWQRLLQGKEAQQIAQQEKQRAQLEEAGKFEEALPLADTIARRRGELQGSDHWQAVDARSIVETLRLVLREGNQARNVFVSSFGLARQASGLSAKARYKEAQQLFEKLLLIRRKLVGEEHPLTAASYAHVAINLNRDGQYAEAAANFAKALAIYHKVLGEEDPDTATSYNNLALNLHAQGKYVAAATNFAKALAIRRKVLGEEHPDTATSYSSVAMNQNEQGQYAAAAAGFAKALAIRRKVLGEEHPETATSYNNVAVNQNAQGKYTAAVGFAKALAIYRKVLGEEHPATATTYNNVAYNQNEQGQYAAAAAGFAKALAIRRKVLGEEHPDTATSYTSVAYNLNSQGKYAAAGDAKALAIRRKVLGEEHPATAASYNNLAHNLSAQGKYAEAAAGYAKAQAINRKILGEEHPHTASTYSSVAHNLNVQGKYREAEAQLLIGAECFAKVRLRIAVSGLDRASKTGEDSPLPSLTAVLARNGKPEAAWQRFEESLARGIWDDLSARLRRPPAEQAKQAEFIAHLNRLDQLIERTFTVKEATPEQERLRKDLLTQRRQVQDDFNTFALDLEKTYGPAAGQVFSRQEIQASMPRDTALVGWLDLKGEAKAADPNGEHWAVLLRATGAPVWVRLRGSGPGDAWTDADTRLPADVRSALLMPRGDWQPLARRLRQQRLEPLAKYLAAGDGRPAVRHLLVLPATALAGVPVEVFAGDFTISYALSGTLHAHLRKQPKLTTQGLLALADPVFEPPTVTLKPLPLPPGGVLLTMVVPGSNAALAGLKPNDVLVRYHETDLAGPADLKLLPQSDDPAQRVLVTLWRDGKTRQSHVRPGKLGVVLASTPAPQALADLRQWDQRLASARGGDDKWDPLAGTRVEVEALRRLFSSAPAPKLLLDAQASEQQLYELAQSGALGQYRYLHFATHGEVDDRFPLRSALILSRDALPDPGEQLVANLPIYDGRLTAEKVLRQWHLRSELVTLSACQTALGKYERGEGFIGFAQAMLLAGSRSVVLSQWKVDDAATALLMDRFYQNLLGKRAELKGPMPKAAALAEAKTWLRTLSHAEAVQRTAQLSQGVARAKGRPVLPPLPAAPPAPPEAHDAPPYAHPYYWAAFVLIGDPD